MRPDQLYRPQHHFSAHRNWINDPNGLVWHDGVYHLFFQYNPFGDQWGHMSWGHATSPDLMHWTEQAVALPEDETASIFSGSIVVDTHNTSGFGRDGLTPLVAIYTAALRRPEGGQRQDIAYSLDGGQTWTKFEGNPVLDLGLRDFRDPKVFWHAGAGHWAMVVVLPEERCAQIYSSPNLREWTLCSRIDAPWSGLGIWECPDLLPFEVEGEGTRWVFKVDVIKGHPSGLSGALLMMGDFDGHTFTRDPATPPTWADWGADFYACLSWANLAATPERLGEQVWMAWMNCHEYARFLPTSPWRGAMSLPRALRLRRHQGALQLLQSPVASLDQLRRPGQSWHWDTLSETAPLLPEAETASMSFELLLEVQSVQLGADQGEAGVLLRGRQGEGLKVGWDWTRGTVFVDRSHAGWSPTEVPLFAQRREAPWAHLGTRPPRLRVIVDRCSVEVFVGDGEITLTEQFFPEAQALASSVWVQGPRLQGVKLEMRPLASTLPPA